MGESSDPLLLSKKAQKLIKGSEGVPGTLLITKTKIKWHADDPNSSQPIAIQISSITRQQQAPGKPFLRILSSLDPLGLAFSSETDKNEVLDFLKQLKPPMPHPVVPTPKGSSVPTLAHKQQLFANNKDLESLYNHLVTHGILTEEEFWKSKAGAAGAKPSSIATRKKQHSGLSSVMHEVERLYDGHSERISIQLTPKDIETIFIDNPEVHKAFLAHVPHALNEQEFWQKYFKLEYKRAARRKRLAALKKFHVDEEELVEDEEDIFAPFRKQLAEQRTKEAEKQMKIVDPAFNVAAAAAEGWSGGFGTVHSSMDDAGFAAARVPADGPSSKEGYGMNEGKKLRHSSMLVSIARDVNRHAANVLEGALEGLSIHKDGGVEMNGSGPQDGVTENAASIAARVAAAQQAKRALKSKTVAIDETPDIGGREVDVEGRSHAVPALDDLTEERPQQVIPLTIKDPRRYFESMKADTSLVLNPKTLKKRGTTSCSIAPHRQTSILSIDPSALPNPPYTSSTALQAMIDIGRGHTMDEESSVSEYGLLAASVMTTHPQDALGSVMVEYFRTEAMVVNELLRHLWSCFPLASEARRDKAQRLVSHLEKQKSSLSVHMQTQKGTMQQIHIAQLIKPLLASLQAGVEYYHNEASKQRR